MKQIIKLADLLGTGRLKDDRPRNCANSWLLNTSDFQSCGKGKCSRL